MSKSQPGETNPAWRGGRYVSDHGYVMVYCPDHPRVIGGCYVQEHTLVAERAIGKYLPVGALVHHVNDDRENNAPANLVVCESVSYHRLIHTRRNAFRATGNVNSRRCGYCHTWLLPNDPGVVPMGTAFIHWRCRSAYAKGRYDPKERRRRYLETGA